MLLVKISIGLTDFLILKHPCIPEMNLIWYDIHLMIYNILFVTILDLGYFSMIGHSPDTLIHLHYNKRQLDFALIVS